MHWLALLVFCGNQTYSYNIRGWLKTLGSSLTDGYTQTNYYQESGATAPRYNGNISRIDWGGKEGSGGAFKTRTYNYIYDHANRLKTANFTASGEANRFNVTGITYDANGNIYSMERRNQRATSDYNVVDDLEYSYNRFSNRLSQVKDNNLSTNYTAKDFKDWGTAAYGYDENGNMTANVDKEITLITYNHLNLPQEITFESGAQLRFAYNATGNKMTQKVYNSSGTLTKTQDYIGEIVLLDGALDYLIHEEGRLVAEVDGLWGEYYLKDHLGNIRQVLRAATSQTFMATMESGSAATEEMAFSMISESRQTEPEHNVTVGGNQVAWLNANRGRMVGPGRTQEIYAGDSLKLQVHGKYLEDKNQKANAASFMAAGGKERMIADLNELALSNQRAGGANPIALLNLADILAKDLQKKEAPEAYLMYALYDQDSNRYEVGKKVLSKNAANQHEVLEEEMYISKDGYMETFVVNETAEDVWFDNMMVMSVSSAIVQETHYDPWGLELTGLGYQYGGIKVNNWKFQSQESIDDFGLNWSSFKWRNHQPDIGRFFNIDPLSDKYVHNSPYAFSENKVVAHVELEGLESVSIQTEGRGIVPVAGNLSITAGGAYGIAIGTRRDQEGIHAVQYINGSMGPASGIGIAGGIGTYLNSGSLEDLSGLGFGIGGFLGGAPTGLPDGSFEFNTTADGSQLGGLIPFVSPGKAFGGGVWAEASYTQFLGEPVNISNMTEGDIGNFAEKLGFSIEQFSNILNDVTKYVNSQNNRYTSTEGLKNELKESSLTKSDATRVEVNRRVKKD
ncbi:hypothetical protein ACPUEN_00930 [Algoriphagus yeomjeoni]|uniref:RHS repeat domain-containing protein n=1 Tax=Algoriphagus yeomjeoni TaxID=291403 RepID=UPI003CE4BC21